MEDIKKQIRRCKETYMMVKIRFLNDCEFDGYTDDFRLGIYYIKWLLNCFWCVLIKSAVLKSEKNDYRVGFVVDSNLHDFVNSFLLTNLGGIQV